MRVGIVLYKKRFAARHLTSDVHFLNAFKYGRVRSMQSSTQHMITKNYNIFISIIRSTIFTIVFLIANQAHAGVTTEIAETNGSLSAPTEESAITTSAFREQESDCTDHRQLQLTGLELLSAKARAEIIDHLPTCLHQTQLAAFSRLVTAQFIDAGYLNIDMIQVPTDKKNVIALHIEPVRIESITGTSTTIYPDFLFPGHQTHPFLNIHDLDQGLEQINRLACNQAQIEIYPGTAHSVIVHLNNQEKSRLHGNFAIDDNGQTSTGKIVHHATVSIDSPLGLSDAVIVSGSQSQHSRSALLSYNVPFGYWLFSGSVSRSHYQSLVQLTNNSAQQRGQTPQITWRFERTIQRDTQGVTQLFGQLSRTNTRSELSGSVIDVQSPVMSKSHVGISQTRQFNDASLTTTMEWQHGLNLFNATSDIAVISPDYPHAQFDKLLFAANWTGHTTVQNQWLIHEHQLSTQYAWQRLYAIEQFNVTDRSGVRGLSDWGVAGDNGVTLHNTLSMPLTTFGIPMQPRLGFDLGAAWNTGTHSHYQKAVSTSVGISVQWHTFTVDLDYARGKASLMPTVVNTFSATGSWSF